MEPRGVDRKYVERQMAAVDPLIVSSLALNYPQNIPVRMDVLPDVGAFRNLRSLTACGHGLRDISTLVQLSQLSSLVLCNNEIRDITPIFCHRSLVNLDLTGNLITQIPREDRTGIYRLSDLVHLSSIALGDNRIMSEQSISPLAELPVLSDLRLLGNAISETRSYRANVIRMLPGLSTLDGVPCARDTDDFNGNYINSNINNTNQSRGRSSNIGSRANFNRSGNANLSLSTLNSQLSLSSGATPAVNSSSSNNNINNNNNNNNSANVSAGRNSGIIQQMALDEEEDEPILGTFRLRNEVPEPEKPTVIHFNNNNSNNVNSNAMVKTAAVTKTSTTTITTTTATSSSSNIPTHLNTNVNRNTRQFNNNDNNNVKNINETINNYASNNKIPHSPIITNSPASRHVQFPDTEQMNTSMGVGTPQVNIPDVITLAPKLQKLGKTEASLSIFPSPDTIDETFTKSIQSPLVQAIVVKPAQMEKAGKMTNVSIGMSPILTRDEGVFTSPGIIRDNKMEALISEQGNKIIQLEDQIEELKRQLALKEEEVLKLNTKLEANEIENKNIKEKSKGRKKMLEDVTKKLNISNTQLQKVADGLQVQPESVEETINSISTGLSAILVKAELLVKETNSPVSSIPETTNKLKDILSEIDSSFADNKAKVVVLEQKMKEAHNNISEQEKQIQTNSDELTDLKNKLVNANTLVEQLEVEKDTLSQELENTKGSQQEIEKKYQALMLDNTVSSAKIRRNLQTLDEVIGLLFKDSGLSNMFNEDDVSERDGLERVSEKISSYTEELRQIHDGYTRKFNGYDSLLLDLRDRLDNSERNLKESMCDLEKWKSIASSATNIKSPWLMAILSRVEDIKRKEGTTAVDIVVLSAREYSRIRDLAVAQKAYAADRL